MNLDVIVKIIFWQNLTNIPNKIMSNMNLHRNDFVNLVMSFSCYQIIISIALLTCVYECVVES